MQRKHELNKTLNNFLFKTKTFFFAKCLKNSNEKGIKT